VAVPTDSQQTVPFGGRTDGQSADCTVLVAVPTDNQQTVPFWWPYRRTVSRTAAVQMCFFKLISCKCFGLLDLQALKLYCCKGRAVRHLAADRLTRDHDSDVTFTPTSMTPVGFESMIAAYFRLQTDVTLSAAIVISRRPEVTVEYKAVPGNYVLRNS
jgi:hypothetical protein